MFYFLIFHLINEIKREENTVNKPVEALWFNTTFPFVLLCNVTEHDTIPGWIPLGISVFYAHFFSRQDVSITVQWTKQNWVCSYCFTTCNYDTEEKSMESMSKILRVNLNLPSCSALYSHTQLLSCLIKSLGESDMRNICFCLIAQQFCHCSIF